MGIRTTTAQTPPRTSTLRDYRTLTLPAVAPDDHGWHSTAARHDTLSDGPRHDMRHDMRSGRTMTTRAIPRTAHPSQSTLRMRRTIAPLCLEADSARMGTRVLTEVHPRPTARQGAAPAIVAPRPSRSGYGHRLLETARRAEPLRQRAAASVTIRGKAVPVWLLANMALMVAIALGIAVPKLASVDAASACDWHTVQPGDTLGNLGWKHHSSAMAIARANHISNVNLIYVGQRLCIPMSSTAQAASAPAVPATQGKTSTFNGQTAKSEQSFVQLALPYAISAHQQCDWPVSLILAQWGVEHGWKIPSYTGYNWGNSSAISGFPTVPGLKVAGSPSAFAYAKTPDVGVAIYVRFCKMGFYRGVAPAAASGGVNAAAVALGKSPWDAGHYTNSGQPGSSLLAALRVYNLYWYDDTAHQGQQPTSQQTSTSSKSTSSGSTSSSTSSSKSGSTSGSTSSSTSGGTTASGPIGLAPEPCDPHVPASIWTAVNYQKAWTVPPGCYAGVFTVNPASYVKRSGYGWCNWWAEVLRPDEPTLPNGSSLKRGSTPRLGATVFFAPFNQGASVAGHYAHVEAISPGGQYVLISEMNDTWRGAGFAKVNYRFIKVEPGVTFIY